MNQGEILIYQPQDNTNFQIEVRIEDDTVWLTQAQMAELFHSTRNNITLHIGNIFKENELEQHSVCKDYLLTAQDGKNYKTKFYSLDVIISVGYRVKSKRGTQFRIWANKVLKDYLLKGYAVSQRIEKIEDDVYFLKKKAEAFELHIHTSLPPHEGIFYDGQIFDAYAFVANIIKTAKQSIILIDNYIDESVFLLLSKREKGVTAQLFTKHLTPQLKLDSERFNTQFEPIDIKEFSKSHDRFIIIDQKDVFHIGASLKDLGKKWFAFSKINLDATEMLSKINKK
jgi:hypothetical protein